MGRRWKLRPCPTGAEERLADLGLSPLLARLLAARGIVDPDTAESFFAATLSKHLRSPMLFRQMPAAAERVRVALEGGQKIGIYGDYDVDGISGSALLIRFLRALGHEPALHIPNRFREGYGVNEIGVRALAEQGTRLMITVDCGGVSHREIALARALDIDTIVCDHHQVSGTPLPAHAVLNPIEADAGFPFQGLCGAGVAFYLAMGVRMRLRETNAPNLPDLRRYLGLVTLGTIADIVPLLEENRVLVKHGLDDLSRSTAPGVQALKAVAGVSAVSAGAVGFRLAPRLNAGGRLADAKRSVDLLTTDDDAAAKRLAAELNDENQARQAIEREILDDAVGQIERDERFAERRSIVLASRDWHPGVIGIVASRLVERFYKPTVLIAVDADTGLGRGSGRSISGFDLHAAFTACAEALASFGGHRAAAGLSIDENRVPEFVEAFDQVVRQNTTEADFVAATLVDAELTFDEVHDGLLADLGRLAPHGPGNPTPLFLAREVTVLGKRIVGENHLKLFLRQGNRALPAIAFGMAEAAVETGTRLDVLFSPEHNEWNGSSSIQLRVTDLRPSG